MKWGEIKAGDWEREKRGKGLLWLSLLTAEMISTNIPLPLTTIQGQGVFVHVCVCAQACVLALKRAFHYQT